MTPTTREPCSSPSAARAATRSTPPAHRGRPTAQLRNQGPNLNQRIESADNVLYAIRNGGYSGAIMPQNIVVGDDAEAVADFVAKYAGGDVDRPPKPGDATSTASQ